MLLFLQRTPLGCAIVHGNVEIAALLLQFGASLSTDFTRAFAEKQCKNGTLCKAQEDRPKQGISVLFLA